MPATANPGFAGDPEWEEYMQLTGDAGLELRVPMKAGPRVVGVSFVRELWEPEGLPQPLQRGRVLTNDQLYMGNAARRLRPDRRARTDVAAPRDDTPSRRRVFVCQPKSSPATSSAVRDDDPVAPRRASPIAVR